MLNEFATWWLREMAGLLPERLRALRDHARSTMVIEPSADANGIGWSAATLIRRQRRGDRSLGRFSLDATGADGMRAALRAPSRPGRIVLRIAGAGLLEQDIALPLAAERAVGQVLLHDMDRLTPFRADAVFWTWAIARRDRAHARLHIRLTLVPRAAFDPLLHILAAAGMPPVIIEATGGDGGIRTLSLAANAPGHRQRDRRAMSGAAFACAALGIAALVVPFVQQSLAARRTEQRIEAVQPAVAEAEALRRRIAGAGDGADAVALEQARTGDAIAALAAITGILPDDTFLSDFSLTQSRIAVSGESREAARLIPALSADPSIRNPSFAAPVTRAGASGDDLFSIHAELAP